MHLYKFITSRPKPILLSLLVITIVLGYGITKLEYRNSFDGELPKDDPIIKQYNLLKKHFDKRSTILIGIEADNIYNTGTLTKIKAITEIVEKIPFVRSDEINSLATVQNIKNRAWGVEFNGFLDSIPQTPHDLKTLQADVIENNLVYGKLVSEDHKLAIVAANLDDNFEGESVFTAVNDIVQRFQGPERIHVTGAPVLVEEVQRGISGDTSKLIPLAILIVFFGFYFCFRKLRATILPALMVILSIIWTLGFMGYCQLPMTVVSNALPVIMVAVASSYGIHFMYSYYHSAKESSQGKEAAVKALEKVAPPIAITGLTSALGSASLLIFKIVSLREFGIIGAFGFLFATIICLTFLPAACSLMKLQTNNLNRFSWLATTLARLSRASFERKNLVILAYSVILVVFAYFSLQINIGDDYTKFFPRTHKGRVAAEVFNNHLSGVRIIDIMLDTNQENGIKDPDFVNRVKNFQSDVATLQNIGSVNSYLDVIGLVQKNFEAKAIAKEPVLTSDKISQYLMLYEMSSDPGDLYVLVDESMQRIKLQTFIKSSRPEDHKKIYGQITSLHNKHFDVEKVGMALGGDVVNRISLADYIVLGKIQNILLALIIVLVTCTILFRSFKKGMATIVPIAISLVMIFGCMGIIGIRLGISTALLTAMVVGIGIDFSVHYLSRFYKNRQQKGLVGHEALADTVTHVGIAIFFDAISNIVGFSVLSFSGFLPVQHFGWLLAFSMLLIFVNTILLYPALFALLKTSVVSKTKTITA